MAKHTLHHLRASTLCRSADSGNMPALITTGSSSSLAHDYKTISKGVIQRGCPFCFVVALACHDAVDLGALRPPVTSSRAMVLTHSTPQAHELSLKLLDLLLLFFERIGEDGRKLVLLDAFDLALLVAEGEQRLKRSDTDIQRSVLLLQNRILFLERSNSCLLFLDRFDYYGDKSDVVQTERFGRVPIAQDKFRHDWLDFLGDEAKLEIAIGLIFPGPAYWS